MSGETNRGRKTFEEHLQGCYQALYRAAFRFTGKQDDAEDLLQEAVIRAYRSWDNFERGTNFKAWMWRILTNLYITHYRQASKRPGEVALDSVDSDLWPEDRSYGVDPASRTLEDVLPEELQMALDKLPEAIRMVVIMTELEDLDYQQTADLLGIPLGTVRSRLFRGRVMMRQHLSDFAASRGLIRNG